MCNYLHVCALEQYPTLWLMIGATAGAPLVGGSVTSPGAAYTHVYTHSWWNAVFRGEGCVCKACWSCCIHMLWKLMRSRDKRQRSKVPHPISQLCNEWKMIWLSSFGTSYAINVLPLQLCSSSTSNPKHSSMSLLESPETRTFISLCLHLLWYCQIAYNIQ